MENRTEGEGEARNVVVVVAGVCVWGGGEGLVTGSKPILRRYVALQVMELISSYWNYETQKQGIAVSQS